jgi:hypothetical protein
MSEPPPQFGLAFRAPTHRQSYSHSSFAPSEDQRLSQMVAIYGSKRWAAIASHFPDHTPKQCRERWRYHLDPDLNKGPWTPEEDQTLAEKHEELGNKWSEIAKFLPGRTDSSVKSRWNSGRRIRRRGKRPDERLALVPICAADFSTIPPLIERSTNAKRW